jgi:DNA polymerase-3 subunit alpha
MEWIPDYIRGKKDPSTVKFPHPLLEDVCRETYGVMVYQEQVMEAAKVIAGYTLGGADMLRRAMGKKDPVAMAQERGKFVSGAKKLHNIGETVSDAIFDILNKFAGYGFNKSHSAAYAIISYQTGYLKANYPVQFMAAVLSSELGNAEKVSHFIDETMAMGIPVLGPDVNESREMFTPVFHQTVERRPSTLDSPSDSIRFGLAGIKGVGEQAAERILAERAAGGPFRDQQARAGKPGGDRRLRFQRRAARGALRTDRRGARRPWRTAAQIPRAAPRRPRGQPTGGTCRNHAV